MTVGEIMSRDVEYIGLAASAKDAAELMGEIEVGALPVGSAAALDGIVTDRDILYRVVAAGRDPASTLVRDILSRPVIGCRVDDSLQAAMDLMAANHIRRLPVADASGTTVGWVTLADVARRLLVGDADLQDTLRRLTEPGA